ncbi:unnamed protein product [Paramecium octaurelia]|uniref:WD40-repeat-containing domain n=1 Tax=Paramecium octaurelia TaxID=43137 RepID=A0A8S1YI46_PAROT|nr:unnamed protein product [Paramecium octaurelia]
MNSIACYNGNYQNPAQFFCNNPFCQKDRLFWECCINVKHSSLAINVQEISAFSNYVEIMKKDFQDLKQQINLQLEQLIIAFNTIGDVIGNYDSHSYKNVSLAISKQLSNGINAIIHFKDNEIKLKKLQQENLDVLTKIVESLQLHDESSPEKSQIIYEHCYEMDFNKDASFLAAGFISGSIKVYNFNQERLQLMQEIKKHHNSVYCVIFSKKSNQFLSADEKGNWLLKINLQDGFDWIFSLITNVNEDMIISGDDQGEIKFWKIDNCKCFYTLKQHKGRVLSLSLNQEQNQLISCAADRQVLVSQFQNMHTWMVIQTLLLDWIPRRLCFINDITFTIQCENQQYLYIYELFENEKEYKKTKVVDVKGNQGCYFCFPQKFVQSKQILMSKNSDQVNFIRRNNQNQIQCYYSINFGTGQLWGTISNDGKYFAIWDNQSCQIQIRKYIE